jgi:hypothetical protein
MSPRAPARIDQRSVAPALVVCARLQLTTAGERGQSRSCRWEQPARRRFDGGRAITVRLPHRPCPIAAHLRQPLVNPDSLIARRHSVRSCRTRFPVARPLADTVAAVMARIASAIGPRAMRLVARPNKFVTNPVQKVWAPRLRHMAIIEHCGRRSGKVYQTPVMALLATAAFVSC